MKVSEILLRTQNSIDLGTKWLLSQQDKISEIKDFSAHYKAPYLMAVTGQPERAAYYVNLFRDYYYKENGDFRMSEDVKGWQHLPASPANRYIYGNGWAIAGLQKLGAYNLTDKALDFLLRFQDSETGGFFSNFDIQENAVIQSKLDTSSTCAAVLALLNCGRKEEAILGAKFLVRMIEEQPDKQRFFYTTFQKGQGVFTDVFHNEDATAFNGRKHFCVSTEHDALYEMVWFIGMPIKILGMIYNLTGDKEFLDGAVAYYQFFEKLSSGKWENNSGTKVMWGAAELFALTGNTKYKETAEHYLSWLLDTQHNTGVWVHSLWYKTLEEQPFQATLDLVQEYISEFCDVVYSFSRA